MSPTPQVPVGVSSPTESLVATGFRTSHTPLATVGPRTDVPGSESGRVWVGGRAQRVRVDRLIRRVRATHHRHHLVVVEQVGEAMLKGN